MNTTKTSLVQKLTLAVLSLILICLVVLIAQNWKRQSPQAVGQLTMGGSEPEPAVAVESEPAPAPVVTRKPEARRALPSPPVAQPRVQLAALPQNVETSESDSRFPNTYTSLFTPPPQRDAPAIAPGEVLASGTLLTGRVVLSGTPPPETPIALDATCGRLHSEPILTRHYVVGPDHGLANVLVYVKGGVAPMRIDTGAFTPVLDNLGCLFEPYVMGVLTGQKIRLSNSDPVLHNLHATPKVNREVNRALPSQGHAAELSFPTPELSIRIKCDVHPWMFAYVSALEHPYFAVTDTNGDFSFPRGLPPGHYLIAATHLKAGETVFEIDVGHSHTHHVKLGLKARGR